MVSEWKALQNQLRELNQTYQKLARAVPAPDVAEANVDQAFSHLQEVLQKNEEAAERIAQFIEAANRDLQHRASIAAESPGLPGSLSEFHTSTKELFRAIRSKPRKQKKALKKKLLRSIENILSLVSLIVAGVVSQGLNGSFFYDAWRDSVEGLYSPTPGLSPGIPSELVVCPKDPSRYQRYRRARSQKLYCPRRWARCPADEVALVPILSLATPKK
jgi:ABC-type transporter Mla subunit MlaD